jgi:hypothetical protein
MATNLQSQNRELLNFMPMPRFRFADLARLGCAVFLAGLLASATAAELGEPALRSYIGQPLVADIELTLLADPAQAVTVRMASADVYRAANIGMHPVLSSLNMTVMRRDGKQFLHITSVKPVDTEYVHLFLELGDGGKRAIRAATLWLSADPNPAPPPPPPKPVVQVPAPVVDTAPADKPAPRRAAAAPACPQQFSDEKIKACAATDYRNGLLSAQIVELEEKVKALQQAMEHKAEAASASAAASAKPAKPVKPPVTPSLLPPKPPVKHESGFPWLWFSVTALLLAAIGGGVYFFLSRRKATSVETAAADSVAWYSRLAARFKRTPKPILLTEEEAPKEA